MSILFKMKGMKDFMKDFTKEVNDLEGRTLAGMINAVITLQREAEKATPIDFGNLRASWFSVTVKGGVLSIDQNLMN